MKAERQVGETLFSFGGAKKGPFERDQWVFSVGQQWVVTGPNGSGKTLLARFLADEIPLRGCSLEMADFAEGHVAMMTFAQQQEQLSDGWLQSRWHESDEDALTVREALSFDRVFDINPFEIRENDRKERREYAAWFSVVVRLLSLRTLLKQTILSLSNGESRRFLLAKALLHHPVLLVLDDPFAGLDPKARERIKQVLDSLAKRGFSMVMMVRNEDEIPSCATHWLRLDSLRMVSQTPVCDAVPLRKESGWTAQEWGVRLKKRERGDRPVVFALRDLTVRYGRRTLFRHFHWTVRKGEHWLVVGPNGSGKTTLMSFITGDNPRAYAADVEVFGKRRENGESLWSIRKRIGQVSPEIQCYTDLTLCADEAVFHGMCDEDGVPIRRTRTRLARARSLLKEMGLTDHAMGLPLAELTMGAQRLVLLARALFLSPDLLILDEACLNLDGAVRKRVLSVIHREFQRYPSMTVICIAHRPENVPAGMDHFLDLGMLERDDEQG